MSKVDGSKDETVFTPQTEAEVSAHKTHRMMGELAGTALVKDYEAKHDELTGLLRKAAFKTEVQKSIEKAQSGKNIEFGIFFADLTNFKKANDDPRVGHERVDRLLRDYSSVLMETLRTDAEKNQEVDKLAHERWYEPANDSVHAGRYGGDELVGLINLSPRGSGDEMSPEQRLQVVAERVHKGFHDFIATQEPEVQAVGLDIAIGTSVWHEGMDISGLLETADKAMMEVKNSQHAVLGKYRDTA